MEREGAEAGGARRAPRAQELGKGPGRGGADCGGLREHKARRGEDQQQQHEASASGRTRRTGAAFVRFSYCAPLVRGNASPDVRGFSVRESFSCCTHVLV